MLVENRAGAAGVIAAEYVAKLPADGSTLLMTNFSNHAVAPSLYPKIGYVVERDFTPIMLVGIVPSILVCRPNQPAQTVQAIIERCRAMPGTVSFGSAGPGSVQHLALEMFKLRTGIDALHIPYKGSAPMITDLIGGQMTTALRPCRRPRRTWPVASCWRLHRPACAGPLPCRSCRRLPSPD